MTEYTNHPAAELFPMMEQSELETLANDIHENGLLEPILIYHEQILDGRNRLAACKLAGVEPRYAYVNGEIGSPALFVASKNLHRRHLSVGQRGAIGAELTLLLRDEACSRQMSALKNQQHSSSVSKDTDETKGRSRKIAAEAVGVGEATVERALKVMREAPEEFEKIKRNEVKVTAAAKGLKQDKPANIPYLPDTPAKKQRAESQKKKMEVGLASVGGVCHGLEGLDVVMTVSVCTNEEIEIWATKAEQHASDLRKFARRLRGANNG